MRLSCGDVLTIRKHAAQDYSLYYILVSQNFSFLLLSYFVPATDILSAVSVRKTRLFCRFVVFVCACMIQIALQA